MFFSGFLQAQTAHFSGATVPIASGFSSTSGVAVDGAGNVFVSDLDGGKVYEIVAVNGTVSSNSTVNTVGSGFSFPTGVAVDGAGNVFVTDLGSGKAYEIVAVNGVVSANSAVIPIGSDFDDPQGLAVDRNGNVFVNDLGNKAIKEIVAVNGAVSSTSKVMTVGGGFPYALGVAVDSAGNVFVADGGHAQTSSAVYEIVAVNGVVSTTSKVNTIASGYGIVGGLAVDRAGDVFVSNDDGATTGVLEIIAVNGAVSTSSQISGIASGFDQLQCVAVDSTGNLYVADGNAVVSEIVLGAVNFGALPVANAAPATMSLNFTFDTGGTISAPVVLTQGASGLDFADAGTGTCTANQNNSFNAGDVCTVDVAFTPRRSGVRPGAVTLSGSGVPIATGHVYGTGVGPQISFSPGTISAPGSGFSYPEGAAVDGAGDVFVADTNSNEVKEIVAVNGSISSSSTVSTVGSGFSSPTGVAVDGAGNVFVADYYNSAVKEIVAVNGAVSSSSTVNTVGSGFRYPVGVAVDSAGNVFVADFFNNAVKEIVAVKGAVSYSSTVNMVGSGFGQPTGVAVDGAGNIFVADNGNGAVKEIVAVNGAVSSTSMVNTVGSGFSQPYGVALDSAGNVFIGDNGNSAVYEIVAVNRVVSSNSTVNTVGSGFSFPTGVAVDSSGNVFVADTDNSAVKEIDFVDAPSLNFASTVAGSTSIESPQSVTVQNVGNAPLNVAGLSIGTYFAQVAGSGEPADCTGSISLAPGSACYFGISFTPESIGTIQGAAVLTDNALNGTPARQSISLKGTGTPAVPVISWQPPTSIRYGIALSAGQLNATATVAGAFSYSPAFGTVLAAGSYTLKVTFTPTDTHDYTIAVAAVTLTVTKAIPVLSWSAPAAIVYGTPLGATQLDATAKVAGSFSYTPVLGTILAAGQQTLKVTFTPTNATDYAANTATVTLTVKKAIPVITWNAPAAIAYGMPLSATQLNATAKVAGSFSYTPALGTVLAAGQQTLKVTFTPTNATDYAANTAAVTLTVKKAIPVITWSAPAAIAYGTPLSATQLDATAKVAGSFSYTPALGTVLAAGQQTLEVTFTPTNATDYTTSSSMVSLMVKPVMLTVKASSLSRKYDVANPALTYTVTGFVNGDSGSVVINTATLTTTASVTSPVGTYPITFTTEGLSAANYIFTYVAGTLTVTTSGTPTIAFGALPNKTYGSASIALTAQASDSLPVTYTVSGPAMVAGATLTINGAGLVTVTASQAGNATYPAAVSVSQSFTVTKAVLAATAASVTRTYGVANPVFPYTVTGFANHDTGAVISGTATLTSAATITSPAGTYPITFSTEGLTAANYSFIYVAGTLTITSPVFTSASVPSRR